MVEYYGCKYVLLPLLLSLFVHLGMTLPLAYGLSFRSYSSKNCEMKCKLNLNERLNRRMEWV